MQFNRNMLVWGAIVLGIIFLVHNFQRFDGDSSKTALPYSTFLSDVKAAKVTDVLIQGQDIEGHFKDGSAFKTFTPGDPNLVKTLMAQSVTFTAAPPKEKSPSLLSIFLNWFPMIFLIALWIFFMRGMSSGAGKALGMGKSRAKMLTENKVKVTFADVAGIDEAKEDLEETVNFLKDPKKYQRLGGRLPRGMLLVGPPGTGKTLTARAVAGEAEVPFYSISGSDFVEMFVGVGAARVRDMFEQAKKNAPCIVFIDELDAVGRRRGAGIGGGNDEREQTLNQMLVEMDGFEDNESVIVVAATNRPDVLDPALLRPGRFDRQVVVPNPDIKGREMILKVHVKKIPMAPDVQIHLIARGTPGFSGADLANLVNESTLLAARRDHKFVHQKDFEDAKDKVMMGAERRSMALTEEEKRLTAYHEAGHAIAALHTPASDPIYKATIIPRGRALGMVMRLPEKDHVSMSLEQIKANLVVGIGGRLAEEIIFGKEKITTGASSDIQMMTEIARRMVMEWGYSKKVGTVRLLETQQQSYLSGSDGTGLSNISQETAKLVDEEVKRIVEESTEKCRAILAEHIQQLHDLAKALMEHETLSGKDIDAVIAGKPIVSTKLEVVTDIPTSSVSRSVPATKKNQAKKSVKDTVSKNVKRTEKSGTSKKSVKKNNESEITKDNSEDGTPQDGALQASQQSNSDTDKK